MKNISSHYFRKNCGCWKNPIVTAIENLQDDVESLQNDVTEIHEDITGIHGDIEQINSDIGILRTDLNGVEDNIVKLFSGDVTFVKWHGAVGDGVTDDTAAIQSAIDSGKTNIIFDRGTYRVTCTLDDKACIKLPSNINLIGYDATILNTTEESATFINRSPAYVNPTSGGRYSANNNITITGLQFKGSLSNKLTCIALSHCSRVTIRDCRFTDLGGWHFIEINGSQNVTVDNCYFTNYYGENTSEMIQLDIPDRTAVFPWFGPYDSTVPKDITISNCQFVNPSNYYNSLDHMYQRFPAGIGNHNQIANDWANHIRIVNNHFENLHSALKFMSLHNTVISGNVAFPVRRFFVKHSASTNDNAFAGIIMSDNIMYSNLFEYDDDNNPYEMRAIYGTFKNSTFSNNEIYGFPGHAITVEGNNNAITGNRVSHCGRNGIYIWGAQNYSVTGNVVNDCAYYSIRTSDRDFVFKTDSGDTPSRKCTITGNTFGTAYLDNDAGSIAGNENLYTTNNNHTSLTKVSGDNTVVHNNLVNGSWQT